MTKCLYLFCLGITCLGIAKVYGGAHGGCYATLGHCHTMLVLMPCSQILTDSMSSLPSEFKFRSKLDFTVSAGNGRHLDPNTVELQWYDFSAKGYFEDEKGDRIPVSVELNDNLNISKTLITSKDSTSNNLYPAIQRSEYFFKFRLKIDDGEKILFNKLPLVMSGTLTGWPPDRVGATYTQVGMADLFLEQNPEQDLSLEDSIGCIFQSVVDVPLLVRLVSFKAAVVKQGIRISWETAAEPDSVLFRIWRGIPKDNNKCISRKLLDYKHVELVRSPDKDTLGKPLITWAFGSSLLGNCYSRLDENVKPGVNYCYLLEDIDSDGHSNYYLNFITSAQENINDELSCLQKENG